jgi:hypothetical protein
MAAYTARVRTFYGAWIGANAFAEAVGLGTTLVLAWRVGPALDRLSGLASTLIAVFLAVLLGMVLEGVIVGAAQELVLRRRLTRLRRWSWLLATAIGAGLAWTLGMIPSTAMALTSSPSISASSGEPTVVVKAFLAAGLGLIAGPILGLAQWAVLRRYVQRAGRWLWANALAWAVGMPLIFLGMDVVPWAGRPLIAALAVYAVCAITGVAVGVIHGAVLIQLLPGVSSEIPRTGRSTSEA